MVRKLGSDDLKAARQMNALFGRAFEDLERYEGAPPQDLWLARLLARDTVTALVATIDETVVGGLVAYRLDKFEQATSEICLYDLAVEEAHRRRGIASALISRLQAIAAEAGASVIFVQADYSDPPAIALYERFGSREAVLHFDIKPAG
ncbi:AAC(3)-I family aminoglycoside N-acetyltransferase [Polymorphobacter multimanifer]|nr:AAC(3)-I family aminoglycoside N-acetyltransferase [Polymorphobacter multimanifer]